MQYACRGRWMLSCWVMSHSVCHLRIYICELPKVSAVRLCACHGHAYFAPTIHMLSCAVPYPCIVCLFANLTRQCMLWDRVNFDWHKLPGKSTPHSKLPRLNSCSVLLPFSMGYSFAFVCHAQNVSGCICRLIFFFQQTQ